MDQQVKHHPLKGVLHLHILPISAGSVSIQALSRLSSPQTAGRPQQHRRSATWHGMRPPHHRKAGSQATKMRANNLGPPQKDYTLLEQISFAFKMNRVQAIGVEQVDGFGVCLFRTGE